MLGCNHLFYYPDDHRYGSPKELGLNYESAFVPTDDGQQLAAWWLKADRSAANYQQSTVVHFHGNAQNLSSHFYYVAWLVRHGYDVVVFDYRGYGESSDSRPTQQGLMIDGCSMIRWTRSHPLLQVNPSLIVIGQSLGGAVAVASLAHCPDVRVQGLVLDSTFYSYRAIARDKLNSFWLTWPLQVPLSYLVTDEQAAIDRIEQLSMAKLFFHNPKDPVVSYHLGKQLFEAAPPPKQWVDSKMAGHTTALIADPNSKLVSPDQQILLDFLQQVLH